LDLRKIPRLGDDYVDKFKEVSTELVMDEVGDMDEENKKTLIMSTARHMAIGAILKRNQHIALGIGIGVGLTIATFTISDKWIKKRKENEIIFYDMDAQEVHVDKGKVVMAFEEVSASQPEVTEKESEEIETTDGEKIEKKESILDRVNKILKKPSNLEDLKAVIKELKDNEKK